MFTIPSPQVANIYYLLRKSKYPAGARATLTRRIYLAK